MNIKSKIVALIAALALAAVTVACGSAPESSAPSEGASSAESSASEAAPEAAATGDMMTEEDYKAKVLELFTNVTAVAPELAAVDQTDAEAVIAATKKVAEVTKASYGEMALLNAPDSLATAHADIKEGAEASVRLMDISLEMIELGQTDITQEDAAAKVGEFQAEMVELATKAQKLNTGLIAVLGADVVSGAAQ